MGLLLAWEIRSLPHQRNESLSVAFVRFTSDAYGGNAAQFELTNCFTRDIGFSAGPLEIRGSNGWPRGSNYTWYLLTHLGAAYKLGPGVKQSFVVSLSNADRVTWRIPIVYARVGSRLDSWIDRGKAAIGKPVGGAVWKTNTAEMFGLSNEAVQRTGASRVAQETNQISSAAGSRR